LCLAKEADKSPPGISPNPQVTDFPLFCFTMPTSQPGDKVLVSGANGYIAIWVVRRLLEKGYSVVGQVRSADKGKHLLDYFKPYGDKFEIAVVPDITAVSMLCS
jgi:hypothetical protein